jgi:uncharacterized protein (DUF302 family)
LPDQPLCPIEIFGNARAGTPLTQLEQTIEIDLPFKVLLWQFASNETWPSYSDPSWLGKRHGFDREGVLIVDAMAAEKRSHRQLLERHRRQSAPVRLQISA